MARQVVQNVLIYKSGGNPFGEDVAIDDYVEYKADILVALKEPWMFDQIYRYAVNFVPFAIIDHSPVSPLITSRLRTAFKVIAVSRFGQRELKRAEIDSVYIPHAVRTDVFRPMEDRALCRKKFYFQPDDFIVLYVGWNRVRKMIPRMLRGYKRFLELNPDIKNAHFMLWTPVMGGQPSDEAMAMGVSDSGVNLLPEIGELGIGGPPNDVRWMNPKDFDKLMDMGGLPDCDPGGGQDMVSLYNAADVVFGCTGGEGFWLVGLEAQASGVPVVVTDYAAAPEIVGAGLTVPANDYDIINTPGTRFYKADIDKMAEALTKIYNADREKLTRRARSFAERYSWENVMKQYWEPFLLECEQELRPLIRKEGISHW